jgi:hypothetical protein
LKVEEGKPRIRRLLLVGVAVMAALAFAAPASAITYGAPDENGHPEICALLALQAYPSATVTSTAKPRSPRAKTTTVSATSATAWHLS